MSAFQQVIASFFQLLFVAAMFALVMKAISIQNDMGEIKDLLRDISRNLKFGGKDPLEGEWLNQSGVSDEASRGVKPSAQPQTLESTRPESW